MNEKLPVVEGDPELKMLKSERETRARENSAYVKPEGTALE